MSSGRKWRKRKDRGKRSKIDRKEKVLLYAPLKIKNCHLMESNWEHQWETVGDALIFPQMQLREWISLSITKVTMESVLTGLTVIIALFTGSFIAFEEFLLYGVVIPLFLLILSNVKWGGILVALLSMMRMPFSGWISASLKLDIPSILLISIGTFLLAMFQKRFRLEQNPLHIHSLAYDATVSEGLSPQSLIPLQRFSEILKNTLSKKSLNSERLFSMSFLMEDVYLLWTPVASQRNVKMSLSIPLPVHRHWCLFIGQEFLMCQFLSEVTIFLKRSTSSFWEML
jgi:hypothetical protein